MDFISYQITVDDTDRRLDRIIRRFLPDVPLSGIYRLLRTGLIRVNGVKAKPGDKLPPEAVIGIASHLVPVKTEPSRIPVSGKAPEILLENEDLVFINKERGIPVHGPGGLDRLVSPSASEIASLSFRSGPLHRLDRETSGVITFSRTLIGARWFSEALSSHRIQKYYLGIAEGSLATAAEWHDTDGEGKDMITLVVPVAVTHTALEGPASLVQYRILTGRKHQIRKQSEIHGIPLAGDSRYGGKKRNRGYFLHAWQLHLPDDRPEGLPASIVAPLPVAMCSEIQSLFGENVLAKLDTLNVY